MEDLIYYAFCAMAMLGALGVLMVRGYVNATMSMLLSMLGVAGLMILSLIHISEPTRPY